MQDRVHGHRNPLQELTLIHTNQEQLASVCWSSPLKAKKAAQRQHLTRIEYLSLGCHIRIKSDLYLVLGTQ